MATFLLEQSTNSLCFGMDTEMSLVRDLIRRNKHIHEFRRTWSYDFGFGDPNALKGCVPIGTIDFVTNFMRVFKKDFKQNPIEIPAYLRTDEFLKREYRIGDIRDVPSSGIWFIKDVSTLKHFSKVCNLNYEFNDLLELGRDANYLVSSVVDILSEWRVYVLDGEIANICNYNGDCTLFPDMSLIKKAVSLIELNEKWLKSYTIDVMVTREGTSLIEIHNFTSVGLYSTLWGQNLLWGYVDGIRYLQEDNHKLALKP